MKYEVKYKLKNEWFWKKIKNVTGDLLSEKSNQRVFILEDETRIEIPIAEALFIFSRDRFLSIKKSMEKEAGQTIPLNRG